MTAEPAAAAAPLPDAFLGVERSLTGRRWSGPEAALDRLAEGLAQARGLGLPLARILARQGVTAAAAEGYLAPRLRDLLPDPRRLRDMDRAAERLLAALARGERVAVFADYDVDGAASAALLIRWLRALGLETTLYVPDRMLEGYGPNPEAVAGLDRGHDLIVCVDCGTLAHEALAAARRADVLVVDHHLGAETLPPALAVVNPNRADEDGGLGYLCAAGVVFLLLVEANRLLRQAGRTAPDLVGLLDLVALATVADVAPLTGANRALIRQGLAVMARRARPGLVALADGAGLASAPDARHLGFVLGPRINAGGRVGRADLGARLLATDRPEEAAALAATLEALNQERRDVEAAVREAALAQAEARGLDGPLVWAAGDGWHPGVVGIVAARLTEATGRPSVVIGMEGATGKGSGRSVAGVDLGRAVQRLAAEGALLAGGGHAMAAGISVSRAGLEPAMARLAELLARQGAAAPDRALRLDGVLAPEAATPELVAELDRAGPFGAGAPRPRFALPAVRLADLRAVGQRHLRLRLARDASGGSLEAIAFGAMDGALGPALLAAHGAGAAPRLHLAGALEVTDWGGRRRAQLRLDDAALA